MSDSNHYNQFQFCTGLRFELFYALQVLMDPNARIHTRWKERTLARLPEKFHSMCRRVAATSPLWGALSDVFERAPLDMNLDEIAEALAKMPALEFQKRILKGLIHYPEIVTELLDGRSTLHQALAKVPKVKQEWLAFAGLYPYDPERAEIQILQRLLDQPEVFRTDVIDLIRSFWRLAFEQTWRELLPQFGRSLAEKERLFGSCGFAEFSKHALLRIEVDEAQNVIKALRGGYRLPLAKIDRCYFMPSAFNDKRLWTAFDHGDKTTVYFPYFDPSITLDLNLVGGEPNHEYEAELDPSLIFRALGDSTRYALASLVAKAAKSSVELANILSVSKPTISHHVNQLREAGLIDEKYIGGSVQISLRRRTLEQLTPLVISKFFDNDEKLVLKKTRGEKAVELLPKKRRRR